MLNVYDLKQWSWGLLSSLTCYAVTIFIAFSRGFTVSTLQLAKFNWQGYNSRAYIWRGDCLVQVKVIKRLEAADKTFLSCFWNGSLYDFFWITAWTDFLCTPSGGEVQRARMIEQFMSNTSKIFQWQIWSWFWLALGVAFSHWVPKKKLPFHIHIYFFNWI